jgi:hypothetical protein
LHGRGTAVSKAEVSFAGLSKCVSIINYAVNIDKEPRCLNIIHSGAENGITERLVERRNRAGGHDGLATSLTLIEPKTRPCVNIAQIGSEQYAQIPRGGLPVVFNDNFSDGVVGYGNSRNVSVFYDFDHDIGPQLMLRSFFSSPYEIASGNPESEGREEQQRGKRSNKRIGNFKSVPVERRPELGSLIFAVLCLGLAFPTTAFAIDAWNAGRGIIGGVTFGFVTLMGLQSTIGLLLGLDGWSIWRMLF